MQMLRVKNIGHIAMEQHIPNAAQLHKRILTLYDNDKERAVSYPYVKRLWNGRTMEYIPVRELTVIAQVLGLKPLDLLEDVPEEESEVELKQVSV